MRNFKNKISILIILCFISCNGVNDADSFIEKYHNEGFCLYKNANITFRGKNQEGKHIYILSLNNNEPTYIILYDKGKNNIDIDKSNLRNRNCEDYLTIGEIEKIFKKFLSYDFYILGCDIEGNVYINPFDPNSPPYFLRLNSKTTKEKLVKRGHIFELYKDNWYINSLYK